MCASVRTAKAKLSDFLTRAAAGEEIVITSDGKPKAKLVGISAIHTPYHSPAGEKLASSPLRL
jgi:prevent-host-death family protein